MRFFTVKIKNFAFTIYFNVFFSNLLGDIIKICQIKNCNVIASGGISKMQDIQDVNQINPFGVILGKALYEGLVSIEEAKKIGSN